MVSVAWARLRRSWVLASASRAATGNAGIPTKVRGSSRRHALGRGQDLGQVHRADAGPLPRQQRRRCASGRRCRRPTSTSAPVSRTCRALSATIATEVSAFFSANVPPKPQHSSAPGSSTSVEPAHAREQPARPVAHAEQPQRVAGRVVGHPVREVGADVGHPEHVDQELATARRTCGPISADRVRQAGVPGALGDDRVLVPHRPAHDPTAPRPRRTPRTRATKVRTTGTASSR